MPLYEYKCSSCGNVFEIIQKFSDEPLTVHEKCGGAVERLVSTSALQFKGSGWYVNDYGKGKSKSSNPRPRVPPAKSPMEALQQRPSPPASRRNRPSRKPLQLRNPLRQNPKARNPKARSPKTNKMRATAVCLSLSLVALVLRAETVAVPGLQKPVEILRDRWGVPHIYAQTVDDLFFAQGYITAKDRLFQIDLWRRIGTGKLAEVLGPSAIDRDRLARQVRWRGSWDAEWKSYASDTREIATAFTDGINAYIRSLHGHRPIEFQIARYDPGLWEPEDVTA